MKDSDKLAQAMDFLTEYIRMRGQRMTPERKAVLEAAYTFDTPFTVALMKEYLDNVFPITRQTIHNTLDFFYKIGLVLKRPIGSSTVEYETCFMTQTHHHLVCKTCGQVFEFRDASIELFLQQKRYKRFKMSDCSVVIYGTCNKCQSKLNRDKRKQKLLTTTKITKQNKNR